MTTKSVSLSQVYTHTRVYGDAEVLEENKL